MNINESFPKRLSLGTAVAVFDCCVEASRLNTFADRISKREGESRTGGQDALESESNRHWSTIGGNLTARHRNA